MLGVRAEEAGVKRSWPLVKKVGSSWCWAVPGSAGTRYERDERLEGMMLDASEISLANWRQRATDAEALVDKWRGLERELETLIVNAYVQAFPNDAYVSPEHALGRLLDNFLMYRAGLEVRDERIRQLELALIDLENWIIMAERAGVALPLPASYGQWRRPEAKEKSNA